MSPSQLWLIGGIALLITEMFAPGFWLINVAVGCFAAAAVAVLPFGTGLQITAFAGATVLSAWLFRPFLLRHFHRAGLRTNADALIGKVGIVTERIEGGALTGRVVVEGENWRGAAINGTTALEPGTRITVLEVDGATLKVDREEPL